MAYKLCPICKEYDFLDRHECSPIFEINVPDHHGDEWEKVRATSPRQAIEKWCAYEDPNSADYWIIKQEGLDSIFVREEGSVTAQEFSVSAESVIEYTAREKRPPHGSGKGEA